MKELCDLFIDSHKTTFALIKINVNMSIENRREINPGLITNVYLADKFIPKKGTETLKQKVVETL